MSEPKTYHLQPIDVWSARDLINCGHAGFYAHGAQSPISHPERMCIFAQGHWYLVENAEFQVEDQGIVTIPEYPDGWTRAHLVHVDQDHPIVALLLRDAKQNRGPDTPVPVAKIIPHLPGERKRNV